MSMTKAASWVVYKTTVHLNYRVSHEVNVVCSQAEWDAMERAHAGGHTLVREGIPTEREAELLARGTSGDPKHRPLPPRS
jgi:hypothetical protein